jgi:hypothetical protein
MMAEEKAAGPIVASVGGAAGVAAGVAAGIIAASVARAKEARGAT